MNLHKFKVGDKIVLKRPANREMEKYIGCPTTVLRILGGPNPRGYQRILLAPPFRGCVYTSEQFDLVNFSLENE